MMYFFSPRLQGYLVARRSARKECGCPTQLCISNIMQRHNVTCRTHITLPHCPVTNALNGFVFASLLPSRFLCQGARDSSYSTILRMYHCNNCNVSGCLPKKCEVDHLTLGSSSIPFVPFFGTPYMFQECVKYTNIFK